MKNTELNIQRLGVMVILANMLFMFLFACSVNASECNKTKDELVKIKEFRAKVREYNQKQLEKIRLEQAQRTAIIIDDETQGAGPLTLK